MEAARHWGLELGPSFALSTVSYVAPAGDLVVKVAWGGDDESLHEPDALELWGGDGAVRLRGRCRCVDCGSRSNLEFDHIVPWGQGGSNTARNLELRCESCNRRKGSDI